MYIVATDRCSRVFRLAHRLNGDWELSFITTLYIDELYPRLGASSLSALL